MSHRICPPFTDHFCLSNATVDMQIVRGEIRCGSADITSAIGGGAGCRPSHQDRHQDYSRHATTTCRNTPASHHRQTRNAASTSPRTACTDPPGAIKQRNVTQTFPCHHTGHFDDDARDPIALYPGEDDRSDLAHAGMIGELDAHQPHVVHFRLTHDRRCHPPDRPTPEEARYYPCSSNARTDTRRNPAEPDTRRIEPVSDSA